MNDTNLQRYPSARYAWYVVAVLTLAYVFSFVDRQILSLLVGPIQRDLAIGDKQMSLLMGASFAVFYTFFGIPLGRLADTRSRRNLVAVGIAFWSLMTACSGLTKRYWDLALMRMGVGVGEATLSPSAYSLISDYFPPQRRATAIGVYSMGIFVGSGLASILTGLIVEFASAQENFELPLVGMVRSWQVVFFVVGLPGLLVALLALTIQEPVRKEMRSSPGDRSPPSSASFGEVWAYVRDNRGTFMCLNFGMALVSLTTYAGSSWIPTMFIRRYGWSEAETGVIYGSIVGICGGLGIVTGGRVSDWLSQRGFPDATLRVAWLPIVGWLPFGLLFPLAPTATGAAALLAPAVFFLSMPVAAVPAGIQQMMPNRMRAQASAVYLFVVNLIGIGLGPTAVATLTEDVFRDKNALHYSLVAVGGTAHGAAGILLWLSRKRYLRSLEYLQGWSDVQRQ